jgi:Cd2+/Zn2+-exporting ATPase
MIAGALGCASLWTAVFADVGVALLAVANSMRALTHRY